MLHDLTTPFLITPAREFWTLLGQPERVTVFSLDADPDKPDQRAVLYLTQLGGQRAADIRVSTPLRRFEGEQLWCALATRLPWQSFYRVPGHRALIRGELVAEITTTAADAAVIRLEDRLRRTLLRLPPRPRAEARRLADQMIDELYVRFHAR